MEVVAEIHFAQKLASNEKKHRDRALKRLKKYISIRSTQGAAMTYDDFIRIWKGLHYCMWMQDKPLLQEELSQRFTQLLYSFPQLADALRFLNAFFVTEAREWNLIDRFRIDKYMMLIRDMLHEIFTMMSQKGWPLSACEMFSYYMTSSIMNEDDEKLPDGLKLHMADIFVPELRKVSFKKMTGKKMTCLMFPFAAFILKTRKLKLATKVVSQTLKPVLREFGSWSEDKEEDLASPQHEPPSESFEGQVDEDEADKMEWEGQDEAEEGRKKSKTIKKLDMAKLLKLMFKMAQDKKVPNKNRKLVFSLVQRFSTKDPSILSLNSRKDDDEDTSSQQLLSQCWASAEKEAVTSGKKNRKNKKRKRDSGDLEASELPAEKKARKTVDSGNLEATELPVKKKARKIKPHSPDKRGIDCPSSPAAVPEAHDRTGDETPRATRKTSKKTLSPEHARSKVKSSASAKAKCPLNKNSNAGTQMGFVDGNLVLYSSLEVVKYPQSPATPQTKLGAMSSQAGLSTPVSKTMDGRSRHHKSSPVVVEISNSSTESDASIRDMSVCSSESASASSTSDLKVFMPPSLPEKSNSDKASAKKKQKKKSKKSPETTADSGTGDRSQEAMEVEAETTKSDQGGLLGALASPARLVRKAMTMVMLSSDPGPARPKKVAEESSAQAGTPGTKKKVVFDLRKNKANNFKDYIKTVMAEEPPVAFEPTKSPSQSILKSPAPSPAPSSLSLDAQGSESETLVRGKLSKKPRNSETKKARRASKSPSKSSKQKAKSSPRRSKSP